MSVLKAAIIGGGHIADQNHLPALAKLPGRVKVISICSRDIHKARALADKYDVLFAYDDPDEMYRNEGKPDIVINCTANHLHYPFTMQALENGCHVFCEKPPAMNAKQARNMADLAQKKGLMLAYNFQRRHSSEYAALQNYHAQGNLGDIYHIKANYLRRRGIPGWGNFTNKTIQGGGAMIDLGVHVLDLALGLTGYQNPTRVVANTYDFIGKTGGKGLKGSWNPAAFEVEDACFAYLSFPGNLSIMLSTSFALNMEQEEAVDVEIFGTKGGAKLYPLSIHTEVAGELADIRFPYLGDVDIQLQNTIAFLDLCEGKPANICDGEQGAVLQSIVEQIYQSAANQ
ncbi:Gfo/Idh/MocA family oxidoreductase [Dyadobacter sp. CY261]|uniref:Gfo/Idh/MocA family protein n=1 Tax=Dyadobacter sp. CY261 TaxID=2907203 RepID=UPI001F3693FF|nr:Gfo/Idh/MocA family oxidoreductase [Dyadobacter sp. CY261]MCF0071428.1 Gfo/Idh/MocA family oxidoreductase [Dyadobacter sp. CY261]